ncbi:MAG TPA: tetratricopeptide repeat protein [Polyangia bacterium]|jgi:tetratricopeptide (TPR) repeat protein|nr:tetratricopeptide repeat protein [Polyangia bacterium]
MVDPAHTLLGEIERAISSLPGAILHPASGRANARSLEAAMGRRPPPGLLAFVAAHDGGLLGNDIVLLTVAEAQRRRDSPDPESSRSNAWPAGLWPVLERGHHRYALDMDDAATDGEWPVVEVSERGVDRVGTSFLRFLHVLCGELGAGTASESDPLALARERARRDPGMADHWLDVAELQERAGREAEIDETLMAALRVAVPPTPALLLTVGMRAVRTGDWTTAERAFEDAMSLEPLATRDDDARLDAAALVFTLAAERGDAAGMTAARRVLGAAATATAAFWRAEAVAAMGADSPSTTAEVGLRIVKALVPDDPDVARLLTFGPSQQAALKGLHQARESLEAGTAEQAVREARAALNEPRVAELGIAQAMLAEALNATRDKDALEVARKATVLNPFLVEGWRELGDAYLEASDLRGAETAFRKVVDTDGTYGLGFAKLAQVLLEQGRTLEALEAITTATDRGGDPFFLAAIRGDIYAEMERHGDAAEAYDQALVIEPDDHWALHQAAVEHGHAGNTTRATELFEAALRHDHDGCHQTLVDYGDHLRRVGRIGDAVKLYRRAVAAVPADQEWRQTLRDAERELLAAPN